jgi:transcription initiation factor TFIIIB Brf1 subunit/transcription initiation factor TFIIB
VLPVKPIQYVTKSDELNLKSEVEKLAHQILKLVKRFKLTSGKGPTGTVAAVTYIASVVTCKNHFPKIYEMPRSNNGSLTMGYHIVTISVR